MEQVHDRRGIQAEGFRVDPQFQDLAALGQLERFQQEHQFEAILEAQRKGLAQSADVQKEELVGE